MSGLSLEPLRSARMDIAPRDEMDSLLDTLLGFAKQQLEKRGEFFPFAASVDSSGWSCARRLSRVRTVI